MTIQILQDHTSSGAAMPASPASATTSYAAGDRGFEQSLGRSVVVLDALAQCQREGLRFTDLVSATSLSKSTLHRLLAALCAHGFVEVDASTARYHLGYRLSTWGAALSPRTGVVNKTAPVVQGLSALVGDTAYFSLRVREMSVCIVIQEGQSPIRALPLNSGDHSALGIGSAAAAILAALPDEEIAKILASKAHNAYRVQRKVTLEHIHQHIERTRRLGYAFVDDLNPDMTGIAFAVRDAAGAPLGALSVATIHSRVKEPGRRRTLIGQIRESALHLEQILATAARHVL